MIAADPIPATAAVALPVLLHPEPGGGYSVEVPALPGCHSEGDTIAEVIANIRDAAEGWLLVKHEVQPAASLDETSGSDEVARFGTRPIG